MWHVAWSRESFFVVIYNYQNYMKTALKQQNWMTVPFSSFSSILFYAKKIPLLEPNLYKEMYEIQNVYYCWR